MNTLIQSVLSNKSLRDSQRAEEHILAVGAELFSPWADAPAS